MTRTLLLCLLLCASSAADLLAQENDTCKPPEARAYLNANNIRAELGLGGMPIWPGEVGYEIPKHSGISTMTCLMTWFGGLVDNEPRVANNWEFWPGPLDDNGNPDGDCSAHDRIYEITRQDLFAYAETGTPTDNLLDWPWHLGAPVLDGDGIADNYNLKGGDRPALMGDQMLWWVMNDVGGAHRLTKSAPIGLEVQVTAFVYDRPRGPISTSTFFRYTLVYKGATPLEDAYFSLFPEADLGAKYDNYAGADTTLHMVYVYNADNDDGDEGNPHGESYGENPPAMGFVFLPVPEEASATTARENSPFTGLSGFVTETRNRSNGTHYYNLMRGLRHDGKPFTYGGDGLDPSKAPTTIFYPGDPVTGEYWSQMNVDNQGTQGGYSYESVISTGPFTMQPGDEHELAFAVVWIRGDDNLDAVVKLKKEVGRLHQNAQFFLSPMVPQSLLEAPPPEPAPLGVAQNYPNPFRETTTIRYSLPQPMEVRLSVYDVLGRRVATLVDERQEGGIYETPFDAHDLPGGVYFYRIEMDHLSATHRMTLIR